MKLIYSPGMKKTKIVAMIIFAALIANMNVLLARDVKRVFWNKFEVVAKEKNQVVLTWNVTEYNNRSFKVQHSVDGIKWEDIAVVQSKNSAETMTDYTYVHDNKLKGKQFYRLQDLDLDYGSTGYSPVRTLILNNDLQPVSIWPNPAVNEINLAGHDSNSSSYSKGQVYDLSGKMMIEKQFTGGSNTINVAELNAGTYVLRIQSEDGKIHSEKFVKQ